MREYREPSCRNLLREPLVLGVPLPGLMGVAFVSVTALIASGVDPRGDAVALGVGIAGYLSLRVATRFLQPGWDQSLIYPLERAIRKPGSRPVLERRPSSILPQASDTLDEAALLSAKETLLESLIQLRPDQPLRFWIRSDSLGAKVTEYSYCGALPKGTRHSDLWPEALSHSSVYSLIRIPVVTDPLWISALLNRISQSFTCFVTYIGTDSLSMKRRIELSRKRNARDGASIANIDSEVSFEEASSVLEKLSRGDECILEMSLVIASQEPIDLDPQYFYYEKSPELPILGITGLRKCLHRSHTVRAVTAADLLPQFLDPSEDAPAILKTPRGKALSFSPRDPRLEALHGLVIGASGSGKSFWTGLILKRLIEQGEPISVLFVDHNRSFRRLVRSAGEFYAEPQDLAELEAFLPKIYALLSKSHSIAGIELSDLHFDEKKNAAQKLLQATEDFLRRRTSSHPVYLVLDECWNFLRDEPVLVQRAFREYRKLNGAVWAITQSLSDFLSDPSGRSILQNAPIRILLRQGEDLAPYRGALDLNEVELSRLRLLRQVKGEFSECLIKTPFFSRIGRLYPTSEEHTLLRTDNLREEIILENRIRKDTSCDA